MLYEVITLREMPRIDRIRQQYEHQYQQGRHHETHRCSAVQRCVGCGYECQRRDDHLIPRSHVITSYSIHYTNLYDGKVLITTVIYPTPPQSKLEQSKAVIKALVITSYSIHYTKLYEDDFDDDIPIAKIIRQQLDK